LKVFLTRILFTLHFMSGIFSGLASADTFTATGGLSFGRNSGLNDIKNPAPLLGADYATDINSHFGIGGFFDQNFVNFNDGVNGSVHFVGAMVRYTFSSSTSEPSGPNGIFLDGKIGLSQVSQSYLTFSQIGFGLGIGYKIPFSETLSLSPKINLRLIRDTDGEAASNTPLLDLGVSIAIRF